MPCVVASDDAGADSADAGALVLGRADAVVHLIDVHCGAVTAVPICILIAVFATLFLGPSS